MCSSTGNRPSSAITAAVGALMGTCNIFLQNWNWIFSISSDFTIPHTSAPLHTTGSTIHVVWNSLVWHCMTGGKLRMALLALPVLWPLSVNCYLNYLQTSFTIWNGSKCCTSVWGWLLLFSVLLEWHSGILWEWWCPALELPMTVSGSLLSQFQLPPLSFLHHKPEIRKEFVCAITILLNVFIDPVSAKQLVT